MRAKLAYLTTPEPGTVVLNVQTTFTEEIKRIEITRDQLAGIVADGARALVRIPVTRDGEL